jgi:hypothetical protein
MATSEGPIRFSGSLGGIKSHYDKDLKKWIYSTKGGANKNLIHNNKAFARTRELNEEWKGCNIWSKSIRLATENLRHLKQGRSNYKLLKIAKRIQVMNWEDIRGHRRIESSKFNHPLIGFSMSNAHPFSEVFFGNPVLSITDDRREVMLELKNFIAYGKFSWPERIRYYRMYLTISEIPDVVWNEELRQFSKIYPAISNTGVTTVSEWMPIDTTAVDLRLVTMFPEGLIPREQSTVIAAMGIEFASEMQYATFFVVKDNGTMAIVGCF